MFNNSFAFLTAGRKFFYVSSAYNPKTCNQFKECDLKQPPSCWLPIPASQTYSQKIELQFAAQSKGIVVLVENESRQQYYSDA